MRAWSRWVALLERREPGEALALVRILVGLGVLVALLEVLLPGMVPVLWFDRADGGVRALGGGGVRMSWLGGPTPANVTAVLGVTLAAATALTLGVGTRVAALVAVQGWLALVAINGHAVGSYDNLAANALWLLVLARSDATWSLSCRLRHGRWTSAEPAPSWGRWLVIGQLVVMYASTGLQKVSTHWVPGGDLAALYYILQQPSWQRFDGAWAAAVLPLTRLATLSTWLFEVGAPLLLLAYWFRDSRGRPGGLRALCNRVDGRALFALFGVGMHLGIHALMDVGPFSYLSIALYPALFHGEEVGRNRLLVGALAASAGLPMLAGLLGG